MDGSKPLSLNIMLEVDQAQSMKNVKKAIDNIGKTPVEIKGLDFDLKGVAKDFNRMVNQSFKVDKNNQLTHMTSQLMNQYGQILTIQQRVFENGTTEIQQANLKADALSVQKKRYEEIRQLYEEIGNLQRKSLTANEKKKEQIKEEIKDVERVIEDLRKLISQSEDYGNGYYRLDCNSCPDEYSIITNLGGYYGIDYDDVPYSQYIDIYREEENND